MKKQKTLSDKEKLRRFFVDALAEERRATPACRHFGTCGGCEFQDVAYASQVRAKEGALRFVIGCVTESLRSAPEQAHLADGLTDILSGADVRTIASPAPFAYRQRMDFVYAFGAAGLRAARRHRTVVPLSECPLLGEQGFGVFQTALELARAAGLESYDYLKHEGELRYFVVRRTRAGEVLLSLVTKSSGCGAAVTSILEKLVEDGRIASGHWLLAESLADVSFGTPQAHVGAAWITETLSGVTLRLGPNTFFQANPAVAELAYRALAAFVPQGSVVLDMYSGVASIALSVAARAGRVTAVECVPENVELARENITANNATNVDLIEEDAGKYLTKLTGAPDALVVNPPRPGVGAEGMAAVARLAPERLAYLSCNPFSLCRDLALLAPRYRARSLTVYDMFPQTRHFETLALLEKVE